VTEGAATQQGPCGNTEVTSQNIDGNLVWIKINVNGTSLFGRFLEYALVDGFRALSQISLLNESGQYVQVLLPHFWNTATVDPDYSILSGDASSPSSCSNSIQPVLTWVTDVVTSAAVIVGVVAAVTAAILISRHLRKRRFSNVRHLSSARLLKSSQ